MSWDLDDARVGIGHTSPNNKLAISGSVSIGSGYNTAAPTNGLIVEGSVGIGISSPLSKLHLVGSHVSGSGFIRLEASDYPIISLKAPGTGDGSAGYWGFRAQDTSNNDLMFYGYRYTSAFSGFWIDPDFGSNIAKGFFVKRSDGNVGIGINTPNARLHINSAISGATLLRADGTNGTLFSVVDDLSDSLMSVNNSAGLPVLEVFADDRIVAGQYGQNDLVVINNKVGVGTANPINKLSVIGSASIGDSTYNVSAPTNGLIVQGNVGIGTNNPSQLLEIKKTTGSAIALLNYNDVVKFNINASSGGAGYVGMVTNHPLIFVINDTEKWKITSAGILESTGAQTIRTSIDSLTLATNAGNGHVLLSPHGTGNVGIGNATPKQLLHINGNILLDGLDNGYTQPATRGIGYGSNSGAVSGNGFSGMDIQSVNAPAPNNGNYSQNLRFWTHHYGLGTGGTPRMFIQYDGNIGVGAVTPRGKLEISNASDSRLIVYETGTAPNTATLELSSQTYGTYGATVQYTSNAETLTIENYGRSATNSVVGSILFKTKINNTTATNVAIINGFTGNVGIATLSPSEKLEVVGVIKGTSFSGAGTGLTGTASSLTAGTVTTNANLTGPITSVGNATTITNSAVTYAKIQNVNLNTVLGRITTTAGVVEELTGANIATIIGANAVTNAVTAGTANALNTANSYQAVSLNLTGTLQFGGNINWNHGVTQN